MVTLDTLRKRPWFGPLLEKQGTMCIFCVLLTQQHIQKIVQFLYNSSANDMVCSASFIILGKKAICIKFSYPSKPSLRMKFWPVTEWSSYPDTFSTFLTKMCELCGDINTLAAIPAFQTQKHMLFLVILHLTDYKHRLANLHFYLHLHFDIFLVFKVEHFLHSLIAWLLQKWKI